MLVSRQLSILQWKFTRLGARTSEMDKMVCTVCGGACHNANSEIILGPRVTTNRPFTFNRLQRAHPQRALPPTESSIEDDKEATLPSRSVIYTHPARWHAGGSSIADDKRFATNSEMVRTHLWFHYCKAYFHGILPYSLPRCHFCLCGSTIGQHCLTRSTCAMSEHYTSCCINLKHR